MNYYQIKILKWGYLVLAMLALYQYESRALAKLPTIESVRYNSWLSEIEKKTWQGVDPWDKDNWPVVELKTNTMQIQCCTPALEHAPNPEKIKREITLRVLSLIREAKLFSNKPINDHEINIKQREQILFKIPLPSKNYSITLANLTRLMEIYSKNEHP